MQECDVFVALQMIKWAIFIAAKQWIKFKIYTL